MGIITLFRSPSANAEIYWYAHTLRYDILLLITSAFIDLDLNISTFL